MYQQKKIWHASCYPGDFGYQGSSTKMSKLGFTFDNNMFKLLMDVSRMKKERFVAVLQKVLDTLQKEGIFYKLRKTEDFKYDLWEYD